MQPEEWLDTAARLLDDAKNEADYRSVAHAAYYAVYHAVLSHFGISPTDSANAKHAAVRDTLSAADAHRLPAHLRQARRVFKYLFSLRIDADYRLNRSFTGDQAEEALEFARGIFSLKP